ncbi:MAG TPA: hypothetical protein VH877_03955 [Polyangia bacterium]|jgi:hypothetical protein|nr:hypothetical protein [Polyangia bacterium]
MGRLGSALLLLVAFAATAAADASLPALPGSPGRPGGTAKGGDWRGRCAERLERARAQAAKKAPVFAAGRVEAWARERAAPGDPTAAQVVDVIELRVGEGDALAFLVQVEPDKPIDTGGGVGPAPPRDLGWVPGAPPEGLGAMNGQRRHAFGWHGLLAARQGTMPAVLKVFETVFRRAVDDCLDSRSHASAGPDAGEAGGERRPVGLSGARRVSGAQR